MNSILCITPMNSQGLSFWARAATRASFHLPMTAVAWYIINRIPKGMWSLEKRV